MQITIFGSILIIFIIIAYFKSFKALAYVYVISYLFQVSSVINIGNIGICPYIITPICLFLKGLNYPSKNVSKIKKDCIYLILFCIIHSIIATTLFEGIKVYASGGLETNLASSGVPLKFSFSNITQCIYLIINAMGLVTLISHKYLLDKHFSLNIIKFCTIFVLIIGYWRYITINFGGWFPENIIYSNMTYALDNTAQISMGKFRFTSCFIEASICGFFIGIFFWFISISKIKFKILYLIPLFISLILTLSTSGFYILFGGGVFYLIYSKKYSTAFKVIPIIIIIYIIIKSLSIWEELSIILFEKLESQSGEARLEIMIYCWKLFLKTYGFGCGLGSSIGTNILVSMLSQVGILGTLILIKLISDIYQYSIKNSIKICNVILLSLILGMIISIGNLSFPLLWLTLAIILCQNPNDLISSLSIPNITRQSKKKM